MTTKTQAGRLVIALAAFFAVAVFAINSYASNQWGNYHWARTANPFTLKVVDSNTLNWDDELAAARADWSQSTVLDLSHMAGDSSQNTRKRCPMVSGQIRSCNASYGFNGWLGLASINITGGVHITQGSSKMNDSYFNSSSYNETNRRHVMCQELGHTIGLDHQDESGADLDSCMDYANALDNPSPNAHDYNQLQTIYNSHLDTTTTIGFVGYGLSSPSQVSDDPESWGRLVRQSANGRSSVYEKDHYNGTKTATHVLWTIETATRCRSCDHRYQ